MLATLIASRRTFTQLALTITLSLPGAAHAQEYRATLGGRVIDSHGSPIAGARVLVTHQDTGIVVETATNAGGFYSVPFLRGGAYTLSAAEPRFKAMRRDGIVLRSAEKVTVDFRLEPGRGETVTVTAQVSDVDSSRSILSQTLDARQIAEIPLDGRQIYTLVRLTAGGVNNSTSFRAVGAAGTRPWDLDENYQIHGSRSGNNEFLIDGAPHSATGGWQYAPLVDAVEEIKVQAAAADASYGRTGGGVVNVSMKSGTNQLRGAASFFHGTDALDANTTQNNRSGVAKKGHRFDAYGLLLRGPVRKDKTFFSAYIHAFRDRVPDPRTGTVPTARQRQGDFSETFDAHGRLIAIYDPLTTRPDPDRPGRFIRDPFPGNQIPADRLSVPALKLLRHVPLPNQPGERFTEARNHLASPNTGRIRYDSYWVRLDHHFSPKHRTWISSTANWGAEHRSENGLPEPALRGNWPRTRDHSLQTLDHVWTLGPRAVLNVRGSYDHFVGTNTMDYAVLHEDLGITTPFQVLAHYPQIHIVGYESLFPATPRETTNDIRTAQATLSLDRGRHQLRIGTDLRAYGIRRLSFGEGSGRFDFSPVFTQRDPMTPDSSSGNAFASFLLGLPSNGGVEITAASARRYLSAGLFFQDDWRLTPRLSLTLGLRWDHQAPVTDRFDRLTVGFDRAAASPLAVPGLDLRGGLVFADPGRRSPYDAEYGHFQPRLGAGYKLSERVVLRSSYGRSYLPLSGAGNEGFQQTGFSQRTTFVPSIATGIPFNTLARPFPEGILQPPGSSRGLATDVGSDVRFVNPEFKIPFADQWMLGFTFDLHQSTSLDIAYVGTRTRRLPVEAAINEVPMAERLKAVERLGGNASYLSTPVANPFAGRVPGTFLNAPTVRREQRLRPFPQFGRITMEKANDGSARYDALQAAVRSRQSWGLLATATYTWMKSVESLGYLNPGYDARPWRGPAANDRTHRLTVTALWSLPFGKGAGGVLGVLIRGWQLNAMGEMQSGTPMEMPSGAVPRPPSVALPRGEQTFTRWFDSSTRANPRPDGSYAWEVLPPNELRTTGFRTADVRNHWAPQWTFSLVKNTRLRGSASLQMRLEAFNAFNTPIYGAPDMRVTSSSFGRIAPDQFNFPRHVQLGVRLTF